MSAPLPLIPKPGVGQSNWHPPMWAVIDRVNELAEIIRDIAGSSLLAGSGISITPNDAGDTIIVTNTAVLDTEQIVDAVAAALVAGNNNLIIAYDDALNTITLTAQTSSETVRDTMGTALVAGANITITVNDTLDTITIAGTGGGSTDPEIVRDTMATALVGGTGVTVTPNDGADTITVATTITQYTDEQVDDRVSSLLVAGRDIIKTYNDGANTLTIDADGNSGPQPIDHGLLAWNFDPALVQNSQIPTAGILWIMKLRLDRARSLTGLPSHCTVAGAGLSNSFAALLDASGNRVALSADQSTNWQSTGYKPNAFASAYAAAAGYYYGVFLVGAGTTLPSWPRGGNNSGVNMGITPPGLRSGTSGTGLTAVPSSVTLSGVAALNTPIFMGLSGT